MTKAVAVVKNNNLRSIDSMKGGDPIRIASLIL